jgi:hypothetical protein
MFLKLSKSGLIHQAEPPLAEHVLGMFFRRGEKARNLDTRIYLPGKTREFGFMHGLARIFTQAAIEPGFLSRTGANADKDVVRLFLDFIADQKVPGK